jgi:hypothetical protein
MVKRRASPSEDLKLHSRTNAPSWKHASAELLEDQETLGFIPYIDIPSPIADPRLDCGPSMPDY